jgi:hypothetical protein
MNENLRKLRWLFARRRREEGLEEELAFHLEEEAEERGYDAARRDLGNLGLIKEDTRRMWGWTWVEQLMQDLRYAVRTMLMNPRSRRWRRCRSRWGSARTRQFQLYGRTDVAVAPGGRSATAGDAKLARLV